MHSRYSNTKPTICSKCHSISSQASFLQFLIVWSPLQLIQVPKTSDQALFVPLPPRTTTTDGQNYYFTPCACTGLLHSTHMQSWPAGMWAVDENQLCNLALTPAATGNINGASLRYLCSLTASCSSLFSFLLALFNRSSFSVAVLNLDGLFLFSFYFVIYSLWFQGSGVA